MGDAKWEKKWWYVFSFSFIFYSRKKACVIFVTELEAMALIQYFACPTFFFHTDHAIVDSWDICHFVDHFYMVLLSTFEQTHCVLITCYYKLVTEAFYSAFKLSTQMVYLQLCFVLTVLFGCYIACAM